MLRSGMEADGLAVLETFNKTNGEEREMSKKLTRKEILRRIRTFYGNPEAWVVGEWFNVTNDSKLIEVNSRLSEFGDYSNGKLSPSQVALSADLLIDADGKADGGCGCLMGAAAVALGCDLPKDERKLFADFISDWSCLEVFMRPILYDALIGCAIDDTVYGEQDFSWQEEEDGDYLHGTLKEAIAGGHMTMASLSSSIPTINDYSGVGFEGISRILDCAIEMRDDAEFTMPALWEEYKKLNGGGNFNPFNTEAVA